MRLDLRADECVRDEASSEWLKQEGNICKSRLETFGVHQERIDQDDFSERFT